MKNSLLIIGSFSGATAVLLGAFAAHGLKDVITADELKFFHTGVEYQFYHTMAILITGIMYENSKRNLIKISGWFFTLGISLFSGSLYLLSLTPLTWIGIITPIGGLCFILGWALLILASYSFRG